MICLRRLLPAIDFSSGQIPYETLRTLEVRMARLRDRPVRGRALGDPRGVRRGSRRRLGATSAAWTRSSMQLDRGRRVAAQASRSVHAGRRRAAQGDLALSGPPGCGKTLLAKALATADPGQLHLGQGTGAAVEVRRRIGARGSRGVPQGQAGRPLHHLLRRDRRPGADPRRRRRLACHRARHRPVPGRNGWRRRAQGRLILGATNRPDILDPALLRPGRFDIKLEIPPPDEASRHSIFAIGLKGKPQGPDISIAELAAAADGFSGAEVRAVCTQAAWASIREVLASATDRGETPRVLVTMEHLRAALEVVRQGRRR